MVGRRSPAHGSRGRRRRRSTARWRARPPRRDRDELEVGEAEADGVAERERGDQLDGAPRRRRETVVPATARVRTSRNSRWSGPKRMWSMPRSKNDCALDHVSSENEMVPSSPSSPVTAPSADDRTTVSTGRRSPTRVRRRSTSPSWGPVAKASITYGDAPASSAPTSLGDGTPAPMISTGSPSTVSRPVGARSRRTPVRRSPPARRVRRRRSGRRRRCRRSRVRRTRPTRRRSPGGRRWSTTVLPSVASCADAGRRSGEDRQRRSSRVRRAERSRRGVLAR